MEQQEQWIVIYTGEGAASFVGTNLKQILHDGGCCCGQPWDVCKDETLIWIIEDMDHADKWLLDESGKRFQYSTDFECSQLTVTRLDRSVIPPPPAKEAQPVLEQVKIVERWRPGYEVYSQWDRELGSIAWAFCLIIEELSTAELVTIPALESQLAQAEWRAKVVERAMQSYRLSRWPPMEALKQAELELIAEGQVKPTGEQK